MNSREFGEFIEATEAAMRNLMSLILALAERNRWTEVQEQQPPFYQTVLLYDGTDEDEPIVTGYLRPDDTTLEDQYEWVGTDGELFLHHRDDTFTHWMPLPEGPELTEEAEAEPEEILVREWISVNDFLPEDDETVVLYVEDAGNDQYGIGLGYLLNGSWYDPEDDLIQNPTHWLPLIRMPHENV